MELRLDPLDLKEEFREEGRNSQPGRKTDPKIPVSQTQFEHFQDRVQHAIRLAGGAVYTSWSGSYNAILPPKDPDFKERPPADEAFALYLRDQDGDKVGIKMLFARDIKEQMVLGTTPAEDLGHQVRTFLDSFLMKRL